MNKSVLKAVVAFVIFIGAIAAYLYWENISPEPVPEAAVTAPPPPIPRPAETPAPEAQQPIQPATEMPPLPKLAESDGFVLDGLAGLIVNQSLMKLLHTENIIRNIVATIDNLPRMKLPLRLLPVEQAKGKFITSGKGEKLTISPKNAARYTPYVNLAEAIDPKLLVGLYVRIYPLFQQAYRELGYPNENFNDRLVEVLEDLLDAPDIREPVKLVQPNVFYLYADPDLEALSIGQRILMRTGSKNEARLKVRLAEIKQELGRHTLDLK